MANYQQHRPFTNTVSGKLNSKQEQQFKQIDIDDLDIEMMSPQFLSSKTLKKPLPEYSIALSKTNPQGVSRYASVQQSPTQDHHATVIFQKEPPKQEKKKDSGLTAICASELNIKPAYSPAIQEALLIPKPTSSDLFFPKDSNTIFAAIMKKGVRPQVSSQPDKIQPKEEKKIGPAESKLKVMMNRKEVAPTIQINGPKSSLKKREVKSRVQTEEFGQIGEEIIEEFDEYGNESFQKISIGYESGIKESIAGQSNMIKESIRESIAGSSGFIKESIREDIRESIGGSSRSLKEEIIEEISASKAKSKESIEEIYEDGFEEFQGSNSFSKSQNKFKKSYNQKQMESFSQSASKSFRMKTNVVKSLKFADELIKKDAIVPKSVKDPALTQEITCQKVNVKRLQQNLGKFLTKQQNKTTLQNKNKDLYYHFKIELNKLISSENVESKLKKLASFLTVGGDVASRHQVVDSLEDNILKNVMSQIENIRVGKHQVDEVERIRKEYEHKLSEQMLVQQVKLRAEMNQKLSEKDLQLKKMIAELESRMMNRSFHPGHKEVHSQRPEQYEVDSDYSIDSDNVSWKADLWEVLPEYEKKKLYDKQSVKVTQFLADIMMNQLQEEALDRSVDISFEFPEEYNNIQINSYAAVEPKSSAPAPSFTKKSVASKEPEAKSNSDFLSDLPKINLKQSQTSELLNSSQKPQELKTERTRKDQKLKPEIVKILSNYKSLYLRKRQQVIRSLLKVILSKQSETKKYLLSSIQQLSILSEREYRKEHKMYIKAYEEELFMNLLGIYNRTLNKKPAAIEEEMKNMYDRLVVVCQVGLAEKCTQRVALDAEKHMSYNVQVMTKEAIRQMEQQPCLLEVPTHENYLILKTKQEEQQIKDDVVQHIVNMLSTEFAREFPKPKK